MFCTSRWEDGERFRMWWEISLGVGAQEVTGRLPTQDIIWKSSSQWLRAQSKAKLAALRNFLCEYFLVTYSFSKPGSVSFSMSMRCPGIICSSVKPE